MNSAFRIFVVSLALAALGCETAGRSTTPATATVAVGALLPLTGSLASYGESSRAALAEAVAAINARGGARVTLDTEDTRTQPTGAVDALRTLAGKGIRLTIGPYASSEVRAAKPLADARGIVLLSPLSTSRALSIPNDNVLRFTPDDELEGAAVAALAHADGIRAIVPVTRNDEGNKGLQAAFKAAFERLGGRVLEGVTYGANQTDFTDTVRTLERHVAQAHRAHAGRVGVYLTAFDEVVHLFAKAASAPRGRAALADVKWYGSDGVAQSKELVANAAAARFAMHVGYPNPILGLDDRSRGTWGPVVDRITARLGRTPDAFALAAYDALMVGYEALVKAGAAADAATLRREVIAAANAHEGLTGRTQLNAAGDRAVGNYDFWAICRAGSALRWGKAATYTAGQAQRVGGCDQTH